MKSEGELLEKGKLGKGEGSVNVCVCVSERVCGEY